MAEIQKQDDIPQLQPGKLDYMEHDEQSLFHPSQLLIATIETNVEPMSSIKALSYDAER